MPQMFVDYSDNIKALDRKALLRGLNHALFDTGLVGHEYDIKSRIKAVEDYLIGLSEDNNQGFIFVRLQGLSGRTEEQKNLMTSKLFDFLKSFDAYVATGLQIQLCVEFAEMSREVYKKEFVQK
ncbi:5-carboxymethyl-2-hydroxymuconate isomerase [Acinetobacter sp. ANC 4558]|uniref:5-carboxymethyl-2-hydroxymuconate Delta-isomerase n=1 Tax=Acinetobacter sp. ANC 4558 TaxID=1977876 RepID=UPI000A33F919|nr:5-carboxymethyl-2-hydroxymuconate isomerase [Acinetobacter sp. ANC 4558]OTG87163.1 5-carboxymethyl-2-hydroxymuconate isomerase [Acinetobacter sp. ANC 4558]